MNNIWDNEICKSWHSPLFTFYTALGLWYVYSRNGTMMSWHICQKNENRPIGHLYSSPGRVGNLYAERVQRPWSNSAQIIFCVPFLLALSTQWVSCALKQTEKKSNKSVSNYVLIRYINTAMKTWLKVTWHCHPGDDTEKSPPLVLHLQPASIHLSSCSLVMNLLPEPQPHSSREPSCRKACGGYNELHVYPGFPDLWPMTSSISKVLHLSETVGP